jgi:hypothetical protein
VVVGFRAITVVTYVPAIDPTVSSAGLLTNVLTVYTALNVVALQEKKHVQLSCATCTAPCPAVVLAQVAEQCMALCPYQPAIQRPSWSPLSQQPVGSRLVTAHMPLCHLYVHTHMHLLALRQLALHPRMQTALTNPMRLCVCLQVYTSAWLDRSRRVQLCSSWAHVPLLCMQITRSACTPCYLHGIWTVCRCSVS